MQGPQQEPRRRYEIRDASGRLVAVHERIEMAHGKRFQWLRPDGAVGLGEDLKVADLPLYGIERLGRYPAVFLVEGEKSAEALWRSGLPAVATVCGASSTPTRWVLAELTGRQVVLWPDNDEVGRDHMSRIWGLLTEIAADVRRFRVEGGVKGEDAADYLAGASAYEVEELWRVLYPPVTGRMTTAAWDAEIAAWAEAKLATLGS